MPLVVAAMLVTLVFAKDAYRLCSQSFQSYRRVGVQSAFRSYDTVGTAFVLVVILSFALALYLAGGLVKLFQ